MQRIPHCAHWGAFTVLVDDGAITGVEPFALDPAPSPIIESVRDWLDPSVRIHQPMVREGWLESLKDPERRKDRGKDRYRPVSWDEATRLVAQEIDRVRTRHSNDSIFAGSYGWGSAGRFHHAQSQVRRLMNRVGGFTGHVETYSVGAGAVIMRHVTGDDAIFYGRASGLDTVASHSQILLVFGSLSPRTAQVESGGIARHALEDNLRRIKDQGVRVILISPRRDDIPAWMDAEWWPIAPGTDTALLLGLAGEIVAAGKQDTDFLTRCCSGADHLLAYLRGSSDGTAKTADWAAPITDIPADRIRALAADLTAQRSFITMSWSLQRAVHGEQPWWSAVGLAAIAGQIGKPGGGVTFGVASVGGVGAPQSLTKPPALPQGTKPNKSFIPVARIADMLLKPGEPFSYDGKMHTYPDARLVYWAGGNPFHHHQDLARLDRAWAKPETIVVQDIVWTATARRADIVLPACSSLERNDIAGTRRSDHIFAMRQAVKPVFQSRSDYDIMSHVAAHLGVDAEFTEGRSEMEWLRHLYEDSRADAAQRLNHAMPDFDTFWERGAVEVPTRGHVVHLADFRRDPEANRLNTESGRIVLGSEALREAALPDCPPHPAWIAKDESLRSPRTRKFPFHLITAQPKGRLHSQLDWGRTSQALKTSGRETVLINPVDADRLGLKDGDTALLHNDRGRCLAGVRIQAAVRTGVAVLPTGAWHAAIDTAEGSLDIAGNPNVLTLDVGSSGFSQGCSAHTCLVAISRYEGNAPVPMASGTGNLAR
jgi:biotin/methionine sulfoxide reductase